MPVLSKRRILRNTAQSSALAVVALLLSAAPAWAQIDFEVVPSRLVLQGDFARAQVLAREAVASARVESAADLTQRATYTSSHPSVATVNAAGQVVARGNGEATLTVTVEGRSRSIPIQVSGTSAAPVVHFDEQVMPVLAKFGCSAGACHAAQYGQGGFKLSVFGFAPSADHQAIVRDNQSRRLNFVDPARSLLLLKATGAVVHGGGRRFDAGSVDHQMLAEWIARGAPGPRSDASRVTGLEVQPPRRLGTGEFVQQLRVVATYSDGKQRDVTSWARYDSVDEGVARVGPGGLMEVIRRGQGGAMVRFEGQAAFAQVVVPFGPATDLPGWDNGNPVDRLAASKFRELGLTPAPACDEATFVRRAFLDVVGTLPTVAETRAFLDSKEPDKRLKLIDRLLGLTGDPTLDIYNNAYAAYWSLKWADLLRSSSKALGDQGMWSMHNWLQGAFRENMRFDRFVRELVTAKGSLRANGPANFYAAFGNPEVRAEAVAQVFLGVRLQCAKCHHHPYETISQEDYYRLAACFARVGQKVSFDSGVRHEAGEIVVLSKGEATHPRTGQVLPPTPLHGPPSPPSSDRRKPLADWLTAHDNAFFARNIVNRHWAWLMGRGLVEPVDDLRATNPASNPELLDALAKDFASHSYDVKYLLRTILTSRLYQLDSKPPRPGANEERFYTHYVVKRIPAEPLLDAIDAVTGVQTKFPKLPVGTRAIDLPDGEYQNDLLVTFGKPKRETVCECERTGDPNLAQSLHTLNNEALVVKIANPQGRVARLLEARKSHDEIVAEFYLAALSRPPTEAERAACAQLSAEAGDPRLFYEDLLWSLINSKQFLFVH